MVVNYGRNWENRYGFSSGFSDETERSMFFVAPPVSRTTPSRKPNSTEQNGRNVSESRIYHPVLSAIPKDAFALAEERTTC
jgi:hypothetical protein|tara:strand:- start:9065 stop:9307 length:243 start_codon:yes stop_codon:yes gene_type:complete